MHLIQMKRERYEVVLKDTTWRKPEVKRALAPQTYYYYHYGLKMKILHLSSSSTVIPWRWARSYYPNEALLICCVMTQTTSPGLKTSLWTRASSVYNKVLLLMGLVHSSESPGRVKPLARTEESEWRSQPSSRRWISLAAEWTKWFHLVTLHGNGERRKHNDTFRISHLVYCTAAE